MVAKTKVVSLRKQDKVRKVPPVITWPLARQITPYYNQAMELFRLTQDQVFDWKEYVDRVVIVTVDAKKLIMPKTSVSEAMPKDGSIQGSTIPK